jgi:type I restriction enzyme S subunit
MSDWQESALGRVAKIQTGPFGSQLKNDQYITGGTPVVTVEHINNFRVSDFDYPSVTEEDKDRLSRYILRAGDIVFTRVGSVDLSAYIQPHQEGWMFSSRMLRVRPNENLDARYLSYFFQQKPFREYLFSIAVGATMPSINTKILEGVSVIYPSLLEQKAIAAILSSLDDKIDLLHRQNQTIEAMAATLFRQWFVEEAQEDWEECTLDDVITVKGGTTPSTKEPEYWNGNIRWSTPRDLSNHDSVFIFDTERKITEKGLAQIGSGLLPAGTVLLSSRAPIGYLAIPDIPVSINQGYIAIVCDKLVSNYFMYLWCLANMDEIKSAGNGSTFEEISKSNFKALAISAPPKSRLKEFDVVIAPIFEKIRTNQKQIRTLEKLRDTLLPKLMSGEVRVAV